MEKFTKLKRIHNCVPAIKGEIVIYLCHLSEVKVSNSNWLLFANKEAEAKKENKTPIYVCRPDNLGKFSSKNIHNLVKIYGFIVNLEDCKIIKDENNQ